MPALSPRFVIGTGAAESLAGSDGVDFIVGGKGDDTLTGGAGADTFVISRNNGDDVISDFQAGPGGDALRLQNLGFADFWAVRAASVQVGADVRISLSDGATLLLRNVSLGDLTPANVVVDWRLAWSGSPTTWLSADQPRTSLSGTSGNDQLTASAEHITLSGGAGDDTYFVWDHTNIIEEAAGAGVDTVKTYGVHGYSLATAPEVENLFLLGDASSSARGNALDNFLRGNGAANFIDGGAGDDSLAGGGGGDIFVVRAGEGSDVIMDFQAATGDTVALSGFGFRDFAAISAALHQVGSETILDLGDGETLTFHNTKSNSFTADDFSLAPDHEAMTRTFFDGFESFDRYADGAGTWRTRFEWWGDGAFTLSENGEQQIYVDRDFRGLTGVEADAPLGLNPFSLEDGKLVITASPIDAPGDATGDFAFSSGMISSQSSFWQTYGYFEIVAELPKGAGAWPAFWLLPVDNSWPPELDVLEAFGDQPDQVHSAVIDPTGTVGGWAQVDTSNGPHAFGMKWTPYEITFYVDGVETLSVATPADLNAPMYMIANLAVGGDWPGDADPSFSAGFGIDSIAAYQLAEYTLSGYTLRTTGSAAKSFQASADGQTLTGSTGNDSLEAGQHAATLRGLAGDDSYRIADPAATIVESLDGGIDEVRASTGYALPDNVENLYLTAAAGNASATGNWLANIVSGNASDNVIRGGLAGDILYGGGGRDTFVFARGDGSDIIADFSADDIVRLDDHGFSTFDEVVAAMTEVGNDTWLQLSGFETLVFRNAGIDAFAEKNFDLPSIPPESQAWIRANIGTADADSMSGSASNERFEGKGEADSFSGGVGDDTYLVDNDEQVVVERVREGIDTVESYISFALPDNVENLTLLSPGESGLGNALANRIVGSAGADTLNGKGGDDWLFGGDGDDVFVFEAGGGNDTVADFTGTAAGLAERDLLRFVGFGENAYLTQAGEDWTIHHEGGDVSLHLAGVTALSPDDYVFA